MSDLGASDPPGSGEEPPPQSDAAPPGDTPPETPPPAGGQEPGATPSASGIIGSLGGMAQSGVSTALGFGLGGAVRHALQPEATRLQQDFWSVDPTLALAAEIAAEMVAQYIQKAEDGQTEAALSGISGTRFRRLVQAFKVYPGVGELLRMLRRKTIKRADFELALRRQKIDDSWHDALAELMHSKLDPDVIATAIQRGVMKDPGYLPVDPPTGSGVVPPMPVSHIDPEAEAEDAGLSPERLAVKTRLVGLPPGPGELLQLLNRGKIKEVDFHRGVSEGNLRNEWGDALLALRRALLSPNNYAELYLRGWIDKADRDAGAALSGMHAEDTDLLFKMLGRPLVGHQVTTGLARGGKFGGTYADVPEPYRTAIRQSNIRPEWAALDYANRHTLPSAFVIRSLVQTGALLPDEAVTLFKHSGWPPDLAEKVGKAFGKTKSSKVQTLTTSQLLSEYEGGFLTRPQLVSKLEAFGLSHPDATAYADLGDARTVAANRTALVTAIRKKFVGHGITRTEAQKALAKVVPSEEAQNRLFTTWDIEKEVSVPHLTAAQVKRAYKRSIIKRPEALQDLQDLGYTAADAATYLDS